MKQFYKEQVAGESRYAKLFTKKVGDHQAIIGCPKGKYSPVSGRCSVPTELVAILHPKSEGKRPKCDIKATLRTAGEFFEGAVELARPVQMPRIKGTLIEVGEVVWLIYDVNEAKGQRGYKHLFNNQAKIYSKPGASWFLVQGGFNFTKNGFVNK